MELCILHLAMSEIAVLGTRHQIVINEVNSFSFSLSFSHDLPVKCISTSLTLIWLLMKAVDLAKRFCDGAAPRIINGCLRTFVKDLEGTGITQASETTQEVVS